MFMRLSDIKRHEFIGLECEVVESTNKSQRGLKGKIVNETQKTIVLETKKGKKVIQKKGAVFRVKWKKYCIDIEGDFIFGRPEDRIKKKFKKW
jgi:ribonuclease P protein subunit POP4